MQIVTLNKEGTIFNKERTKKIEYIKVGAEYHFKVYHLIQDKTSRRYESTTPNSLSMTKKQLENFIYTELYEIL